MMNENKNTFEWKTFHLWKINVHNVPTSWLLGLSRSLLREFILWDGALV